MANAITRLTNASEKLRANGANFGSLSSSLNEFIGSTSRIKNLESTTNVLNKLSNATNRFKKNGSDNDKPLGTINIQTQKLSGNVNKLGTNIKKMTGIINVAFLYRIYNAMKRIGSALYDLIKLYAEYQENINLATVAYNGLENASKSLYPFVEQISKAFGLNESEVIRSVGLFKQMANAMGLAQETGELLSETLTKMAYDISSLYNISFERSMNVLQASLAGQTKPINSSSFTWKHVLKNLVNVCKNGVAIIRKVFKQEMAYSYCY